jgi:hypothetical protein
MQEVQEINLLHKRFDDLLKLKNESYQKIKIKMR